MTERILTDAEIAAMLALAKQALGLVRVQNDESLIHRRECTYCSRGSFQRAHDPECPTKVLATVPAALCQLQATRAALREMVKATDSVKPDEVALFRARVEARKLLGVEG